MKSRSMFPTKAIRFSPHSALRKIFSSAINLLAETLQYDNTDWKKIRCDKIIFPPIVYSPAKPDYANADYAAPGSEQFFSGTHGEPVPLPKRFSHWLGTDKLGRDVLSGLIHGTRISLTIGIFSMAIAAFIGILLGALAGFFGDHELKTSRGIFWALLPGCITGWFYAFDLRSFALKDSMQQSAAAFLFQLAVSIVILVFNLALFYFLGKIISKISFFKKQVFIKADSIVSRLIEILISLPRLILIISVAAIARPSLINLIIIIGLTSWTEIARLTRAEFLRLRHLEFIEAARALGYSRTRIIFRHALPNGIAPALVAIAFGVASAILAESALSFLGIGVPQDVVTWGSLLAQGKENYNAWWLVIFPGLAIFITVTVYNLIGDGLRDAMDPKLK
jgi:peptide/nickel transport system permease protein